MRFQKLTYVHLLPPTLVVLLAAGLRIYQLAVLPTGLFYDESANGVDALRVLAGVRPVFFTGDQGREPLQIYLEAMAMAFLGPSPFALRLPSVALGILTVAATYATFRSFAGSRTGLIGAALVGASYWHLSLSRVALRADGLPLFATMAAFWLWKGVRTGKAHCFAIGGALVGIDLYTYIPARLAPPLFGLWLLGCLFVGGWRNRTSRKQIGIGAAVALIALTLVVSPLARYFIVHPTDFLGRIQSVSVGSSPGNPATGAVDGFRQAGLALFWNGDPDPLHNLAGRPLIDLPLGVLGVFGIILAVRRWREGTTVLALVWCLAMLAPSALSVEPAHGLRLVGELPFILLFPALSLDWLAGTISFHGYRVGVMLAGLVVIAGFIATTYDYFDVWASRPDTLEAFQTDLLDSLSLVARIPASQTAFATARVYDGVSIPLAMVPSAQTRVRSYEGLNTFVEPADGTDSTYYVIARSMVPPGGLPAAAHLILLGTSENRIGQVDGRLYVATPPGAIAAERELTARIGEAVEVTGADVPPLVHPGGTAVVALHWTVRGQLPPGNWELFAHLVDRQHQTLLAQDYNDGFPLSQWRSGDRVISWFLLPVGLDSLATITEVDFGILDGQTGQRLPVMTPAGAPAGDTIVVGPMRIDRPQAVPPPEHPLLVHFGKGMTLLGYDFVSQIDGTSSLRLHWRADQPMAQDYTIFAHLLNAQSQLVAGADSQPGQGQFPTSTWAPGEVFLDDHPMQADPHVKVGQVEFGVYLLATGERLPVTAEDGRPLGDAIRVEP